MMRDFLRINFFWVGVAFFGGVLVAPIMTIGGIAPDFAVISLVVLGLAAGPYPATVGGFFLGLVLDLSNPALLGTQSLINSLLGFGLGRLRRRLAYGMPVVEATVVALAVVVHDFVLLLVQSLVSGEPFWIPFVTQSLPVAIYSGLVAIPLLRWAAWLGLLYRED